MANGSFIHYGLSQPPLTQPRSASPVSTKTIPFDYAFQFTLTGTRNNKVQDVVEISMEGVFVAVSIGYSVVGDERKNPRNFEPSFNARTTPQPPVMVPIVERNGSGPLSAKNVLVT